MKKFKAGKKFWLAEKGPTTAGSLVGESVFDPADAELPLVGPKVQIIRNDNAVALSKQAGRA